MDKFITPELIQQFKKNLQKSKTVVITTHLVPDADGIGGEVALYYALRSLGKKVYCVNEEPLSDRYNHLLPSKSTSLSANEFNSKHNKIPIDLFIVVDTSEKSRIGEKMREIFNRAKMSYCIDHHPTRKDKMLPFSGKIIDLKSAATGEIVAKIIKELKVPLTKKIALPLYTALLIDTSSFRYPTVTSKTHQIISELLATGINPAKAYDQIYGTKVIGNMQLLGEILLNAKINKDKDIAWITISDEMLKKYKCSEEDTYSFVNYLLVLKDLKLALMFRHKKDQVRVSIRSVGKVNVDEIASILGGGGHNHSSAATLKGEITKIVPKVIRTCHNYLSQSK